MKKVCNGDMREQEHCNMKSATIHDPLCCIEEELMPKVRWNVLSDLQ